MERNTLQLVYAMTGVVSGKVRTSLIILGSGASVPQRIPSTEIWRYGLSESQHGGITQQETVDGE